MKIDMWDCNDNPIELGDKVRIINGQVGEVVYECGAFGVAIQGTIDYEKIQSAMDADDWCCGNRFSGVKNDNFISLWELFWNSNSEDDSCRFVEVIESKNNAI